MASRSDRIEKEVPEDFTSQFDLIESIWSGGVIQLARHVPTGFKSPRQSIVLWALSTIPNEAINRAPLRVATGATAAATDTGHCTAYSGGGSSKNNHGSRKHKFSTSSIGQARRETSDQPKIRSKITPIAASPSLTRAWRLRASSAHSREAENHSFLASAAKKK